MGGWWLSLGEAPVRSHMIVVGKLGTSGQRTDIASISTWQGAIGLHMRFITAHCANPYCGVVYIGQTADEADGSHIISRWALAVWRLLLISALCSRQ